MLNPGLHRTRRSRPVSLEVVFLVFGGAEIEPAFALRSNSAPPKNKKKIRSSRAVL
jgi:hypothetical protein